MHITPDKRGDYMREHFWDKFDFTDTLYITKADRTKMLRVYASFVSNFVGASDPEPIRQLMLKASVSKPMMEYFVGLSEEIFADPNSPLRNDELYMAVLDAQIASPHYDEYEKLIPQATLHILSQNRINHTANDFRYTLASGRVGNLHSLKADFIILYFNNPDCPMCRQITASLRESPLISSLQREGKLQILSLYPDEDVELWFEHVDELPKQWINAYDKELRIDSQNLYDLRAIPSLYLLDGQKKVLAKDATSVEFLEQLLLGM